MLIVRGPLEENVANILWGNVVAADCVHAISHILAAECANASPMIIVCLGHIPVILCQQVDVSGAKSVTSNNCSLVFLSTSNRIVWWGNLRGGRELVESTVICATSLEGVTDYFHVLWVSSEDKSDILKQINNACTIWGLTIVNCNWIVSSPASWNSVEAGIHDSSVKILTVLHELSLISNVSHGSFK